MNRLSLERRTQVINCLIEGNSIRSTERMTGTHRDTVMRLLVEVGSGCAALLDRELRDVDCWWWASLKFGPPRRRQQPA